MSRRTQSSPKARRLRRIRAVPARTSAARRPSWSSMMRRSSVYDPTDFNDRLLLGLKGTISAAELHVLTSRLVGGQRNKARRGALEVPLPIGLVYNAAGAVVLDPDPRIQAGVRLVFDTFRQMRSTHAVQDRFRREGLEFPCRIRG